MAELGWIAQPDAWLADVVGPPGLEPGTKGL